MITLENKIVVTENYRTKFQNQQVYDERNIKLH